MKTNIDISLLNSYFTNKTNKSEKGDKKEKTQSKIVPYNFFSKDKKKNLYKNTKNTFRLSVKICSILRLKNRLNALLSVIFYAQLHFYE